LKVIEASTPDPGALTPTGPALTGAVQQAQTWAAAHTDHQVVAVLATDGLPTLKTMGTGPMCAPVRVIGDIDAVVNVANRGRTGTPSVSTFVIGVMGPDDAAAGATTILDSIANAGGTNDAFLVDTTGDVQAEFRDALNQIRAKGLSCDLAVPKPDAGKQVDFGAVNVNFDGKDLAFVGSAAGCDRTSGGWYYNVDDYTKEAPTRILTCPTTCTQFQATNMGSVQIKLGCRINDVK
jgi:hypothetical protein